MTTTPPDSTSASRGEAEVTANAGARAKVLGWARRSIDLIPTSWLITGAGAVLLATTALFGGLEAAAVDPIPDLTIGETFSGSDFEMTVVGVELRDERGMAAIYPDEEKGERLLVVTVDVVNTFSRPRASGSGAEVSPLLDGIRIEGLDAKGVVSRADDGKLAPTLQPDVPARVLITWAVGPDDFRDGDEVSLTLPDSDHYVGQSLIRGDYWNDPRVGATLTTTIEEVSAG
ncbi:hypothetical protein [Microbacterium sp. 2RAF4]|uniref:hypothetical protein n=1 Tax=Microbacterium sp. 2RAF4 TaxID=3232999 RepID=UPI003F9E9734